MDTTNGGAFLTLAAKRTPSKGVSTRPSVGVPGPEQELTDALVASARKLVPPGSGRTLFVMTEVELGVGRPDVLLMVASIGAVRARKRAGLRLANLAEATVLAAHIEGRGQRYSKSYVSKLNQNLVTAGWMSKTGAVRKVDKVVTNSVMIEAKMADWGCGVRQLAKTKWACHMSVLLMPHKTHHRVKHVFLEFNNIGLLVHSDGNLNMKEPSSSTPLSILADLWLTELAIRSLPTST